MKQGEKMIAEAMGCMPSMSCAEYDKFKNTKRPYVLLDVREQSEWDAGHMEEAVHLPRGVLEVKVEDVIADKNVQVIILCAKGGRSALAAQTLKEMGYRNVMFLAGGFDGYCGNN